VYLYRSILAPTDGSKFSDKAVQEAAKIAKVLGAELFLLHAAQPVHLPPVEEAISEPTRSQDRLRAKKKLDIDARHILAVAAKKAARFGVSAEQQFVVSKLPYKAIIDAATARGCDLIVMASHGRHGLAGVLLGSETQKVLTHSKIPVLVVR
jgi:nucleotide-binding universal stress UspA family protein